MITSVIARPIYKTDTLPVRESAWIHVRAGLLIVPVRLRART